MKIKFEIHSSLLKGVKELSDSINESMRDFGCDENIKIGWKIGEVTVDLPETETKESIRLKLEKVFREELTDQIVWLKEIAYEK